MITTHATEAADAATNINREDWINGATDLVMSGEHQYDRSTRRGKEAFISLDNVMEDVLSMNIVKKELSDWLLGGECCDHRDNFRAVVEGMVSGFLSQMADDFNIGVRQ